MALAKEVTIERGKPIDLSTAAGFLPLIARESPSEYNAWAVKWLARWLNETPATIERAAELAGTLAELPGEPSYFDAIREAASRG